MLKYQMFIDGKYVDSASDKWFDGCNPYAGVAMAELRRVKT